MYAGTMLGARQAAPERAAPLEDMPEVHPAPHASNEMPMRAAAPSAPALPGLPAPLRHPAYRRAARRVLRLLRPLALPFLHRLDWRIRGAVDRSETSAAVARIESTLARLEAQADAAAASATAQASLVHARLTARFDALDKAREADRAEILRAIAAARVPEETLAGLALRLDAARMQLRGLEQSARSQE